MDKKYLKKIIAQTPLDLQMISACCSGAKVDVSGIKYLSKNKIFLLSLIRESNENENTSEKIDSIIKFDYIDSSKSKNIDQNDQNLSLKLIAIDLIKKDNNYQINLLFSDNAFITLTSETVEVTLEDQKKIKYETN